MGSALSAAAFLLAGSYIAPAYKKETALILVVIYCLVSGASLYITNFIAKDRRLTNGELVYTTH